MQYFTYQDHSFSAGDTIAVHQEISEGNKKRVQIFEDRKSTRLTPVTRESRMPSSA